MSKMKYVKRDGTIREKHYEERDYQLTRKYSTLVEVRLRNLNTGEIMYQRRWVAHDRLMKRSEIEEIVEKWILDDATKGSLLIFDPVEIVNIIPVRGVKSKGA